MNAIDISTTPAHPPLADAPAPFIVHLPSWSHRIQTGLAGFALCAAGVLLLLSIATFGVLSAIVGVLITYVGVSTTLVGIRWMLDCSPSWVFDADGLHFRDPLGRGTIRWSTLDRLGTRGRHFVTIRIDDLERVSFAASECGSTRRFLYQLLTKLMVLQSTIATGFLFVGRRWSLFTARTLRDYFDAAYRNWGWHTAISSIGMKWSIADLQARLHVFRQYYCANTRNDDAE